jgi:hypothetical protein
VIVSGFPEFFAEFKEQEFISLWRGSRDGFGVRDFHSRCDGHANTLTVILDTDGNIFGGFTPVDWDSDSGDKADPSLKSFLFTLNNPHNFPARRFALKSDEKHGAIRCGPEYGPHFGDIGVFDNCNTTASGDTQSFGCRYTNDTGLDGKTLFTNGLAFQVKEIEVFEIIA